MLRFRIEESQLDAFSARRAHLLTRVGFALLMCAPNQLSARLEWPASLTGLTEYVRSAPTIFRGRVLSVSLASGYDSGFAVARFEVDRWYRRQGTSEAEIYFAPYREPDMRNGHDCIDFRAESHWIVFATEIGGRLRPFDDCTGALPVSTRVAPIIREASMSTQMEADFIAGLEDNDQQGRLLSIQRLGGLRFASSRPVLRRVIEMGDPAEVRWAVYAALHAGDTSVLPTVRQMLAREDMELPVRVLGVELCRLNDYSASDSVELIGIANTAVHPLSRECAISALVSMKSRESLPTMASHLSDSDQRVRYQALRGVEMITQDPACALTTETTSVENVMDRQVKPLYHVVGAAW